MMKIHNARHLFGLIALVTFSALVSQSQAPQSRAGNPADARTQEVTLNAATRHPIIDAAIKILNQYYTDADVAQKMADALLAHEKNGDDDAATNGEFLADLLTRQMKNVSHDRHLAMEYSRNKIPEGPPGPPSEIIAQFREDMKKSNCTFEIVRILPHNIGYLKLNSFPDPSICQASAAAAMAKLNNVDAIIFDLRDNRGGDPKMVALMATYLFDHPTHLNDIYNRAENSTQQSWTREPIPGNKLADKLAYVLTSASTFSGAEEFCYDLKMLKRATLVGETTRGGAHMTDAHRIDDHFRIFVPEAKPINPISKTDWEGTGVEPDVKVKAADALEMARRLAESKLHKSQAVSK
ncbi:MAG TPA: S41 family peptidase [Candidatus Angelobacter sp.]